MRTCDTATLTTKIMTPAITGTRAVSGHDRGILPITVPPPIHRRNSDLLCPVHICRATLAFSVRKGEVHLVELTNPLRARLASGGIAAGIGAKLVGGVELAPLMRAAGFDWLFIDLEHGKLSVETACDLATASLAAGIAPIVRIPAGQYWLGARVLDGGALGIVMPHVDTPEQARGMVDAFRFAPLGHRSMSGNYPHFGFASVPTAAAAPALDTATFLIAMIETPQAVEAAEAIAAVPGLDGLLVGCSDLSAEMGIPGQVGHERIVGALERVV